MRQRGRNQNTRLDLIQRSKIKFEKLSMSRPAVILPTARLDPRFGDKFEYANTLPSKIVNCELYRSKQFCAIYCTPTERSPDSNEYKLNPKRFNISKWLLRITFKANRNFYLPCGWFTIFYNEPTKTCGDSINAARSNPRSKAKLENFRPMTKSTQYLIQDLNYIWT